MRWIRYAQMLPQRYALKRDIPKAWHLWAVRIQFNFEIAWIVRDDQKRVLMPDGEWVETFDFHLRTPGHVIGLRDLQTADAHDWAPEWRAAMTDRINDQLSLQAETGGPR